ncbi:MAG: 4Fe-4S dicluster domain-containing protein [Spirochaetales bacterium]|nr:4Fe-4S dicluster domain-containing protein [Spirochaetales bacterium]MCF7938437.1 4Fe-4S dicluster domain-containing protein [Spirochaetales bacterium]
MAQTSEGNYIVINPDECKGCRLCIEACPFQCIVIGSDINSLGYQYAKFEKPDCTACGLCFYACPEPGAITVYKAEKTGGKA